MTPNMADCNRFRKRGFSSTMDTRRIVTLALAALFLLFSCSTAPGTAARKLEDLNIPLNVPAFVDRAGRGDLNAVRLFLDSGMRPDARNLLGQTALLASVTRGHGDVVQLLLNRGADPNLRFDTHFSQVQIRGLTVLMAAAEEGYGEVVRVLLEKGALVNAKAGNGLTALMAAAAAGHPDIVEILLKDDADPNAKTTEGETSLTFAVKGGHAAIIQLLKDAGAEE